MRHPPSSLIRYALCAALALGAALSGASRDAHAGAFFLAERGARSFSLGGAHIAGSDDMNAQWLNPAGLTRLAGNLHLYLDAAVIGANQSFARAYDAEVARRDPAYANGFPVASSNGEPFFDPSLGIATRFGLKDWIFALGVYGPYAGTNKWDVDGPQRYALTSLAAVQLNVQLSVAWQPHERFAVGLGLQAVYTSIGQRVAISSYPGVFGWQEDRELDVLADVALSGFAPSGNIGLIWTPVDGFDVGFSAQLPVHAELEGKLQANLATHWYFSETTMSGDKLKGSIDFPAILRLGLRVYDDTLWSLELASVLELWSVQNEIPITPQDIEFRNVPGIGTFRVKPMTIKQDFNDVLSVRLGGSFRPGKGLVTLRAGTYFETGAAPDSTISALRIDGDKLGFGLGATFHLGALALDLAGGYVQMFARTVTTSEKKQINPIYAEDSGPYGATGPNVVGNGRYELSHWVVSMALNAGW